MARKFSTALENEFRYPEFVRLPSFVPGPDRQGRKTQTQTPKGRDEL